MTAPIGIGDLFHDDDSDAEHGSEQFNQLYEIETISLGGIPLKIRQFSFHETNANQVWPGTYRLADYIMNNISIYSSGTILELGAATGALSLYLRKVSHPFNLVTSDLDDGGVIEENIIYNFNTNEVSLIPHIPYTWGKNWKDTIVTTCHQNHTTSEQYQFKYIIASDILLYVSAYPALVNSLQQIFHNSSVEEFLMSWNRRIAESKLFFDMMIEKGFTCIHHGNCIYSFTLPQK